MLSPQARRLTESRRGDVLRLAKSLRARLARSPPPGGDRLAGLRPPKEAAFAFGGKSLPVFMDAAFALAERGPWPGQWSGGSIGPKPHCGGGVDGIGGSPKPRLEEPVEALVPTAIAAAAVGPEAIGVGSPPTLAVESIESLESLQLVSIFGGLVPKLDLLKVEAPEPVPGSRRGG
mmetsp:Transcript_19085/g.41143  ORF Transcript_19085/g.41143 Transcript_19085/m.41143 type:complete len:176 (+) Transcript_19085:267-794(+)